MERFAATAVIGIGNEFRRDDGVGWAVVALLRERAARRSAPPGALFAQCDGDPGRLIGLWDGAGLAIVVDACFPPSAHPGRVHRCTALGDQLRPSVPGRHSTHGLGLAEALRLGDSLGRRPGCLVVYAVEGADRSLGPGLTPAVARIVPRLAERIEAEVEQHGETPGRSPAAG